MINIYKLKLTSLQQEILRLLFIRTGKQLNQNNIAKALNVSPAAVMKALPKIRDGNLINMSQDKESKRWAIELNTDNHRVMQIKRAENLKMLYESGLADFLEETFPGCTIILFGSYSRGEDILTNETDKEKSDIDIAIETDEIEEYQVILLRVLENFEHLIGRHIQLHLFNRKTDLHVFNNIANGIVLSGFLEVKP